jgi:hypothetical protein
MVKKRKLKRKVREARRGIVLAQQECAGLRARATGQQYRTDSLEARPVYHWKRTCPDGLDIEPEHLVAGPGTNRNPCLKCQDPATR